MFRKKILLLSSVFLFLLFPLSINVKGCSHFTASDGEVILAGNNKDTFHKNSHIWVYPSTEEFYGRILFGVIEGIPGGWTYIQCGMNDQGLFIDGADNPNYFLKTDDNKTQFPGEQIRPYILERCTSVNETIELLNQFNYENPWYKQYLVADRFGEAMLVSAGLDGKLSYTRKEGIYLHGTNFNINDPFPCSRYIKAQELLDAIVDERNMTIDYFKSILASINQSFTVYSNIYDLIDQKIYIFLENNFKEVRVLYLKEELNKGEYNCSLSSLITGNKTYTTSTTTTEIITTILTSSETTSQSTPVNYCIELFILSLSLISLRRISKYRKKSS